MNKLFKIRITSFSCFYDKRQSTVSRLPFHVNVMFNLSIIPQSLTEMQKSKLSTVSHSLHQPNELFVVLSRNSICIKVAEHSLQLCLIHCYFLPI